MGEREGATLSLVLLTFNRWDRTRELLDSLLLEREAYAATQLVWVENGSGDGTREEFSAWLREYGSMFHSVTVSWQPENLGFIRGVNTGIDLSTGTYLCLINSDAQVTPGWARSLLRAAAGEGVAAVGPVSNGMPWAQSLEHFGNGVREEPVVYGFCLVTARAVLDRVGLLDERYGRGVIEVEDWCERARRAGLRFLVDTDVLVRHDEPHASYTPRTNALLHIRNRLLFQRKWGVGPYHWGDRTTPLVRFAETAVLVEEPESAGPGALAERLHTMRPDQELLVVTRRSTATEPEWARVARVDPRLNVVRVARGWDTSALTELCVANGRGAAVTEVS